MYSIFWHAATRQLLSITAENQDYGVLQLAKCLTLLATYDRKSILWCVTTRQVLQIVIYRTSTFWRAATRQVQ